MFLFYFRRINSWVAYTICLKLSQKINVYDGITLNWFPMSIYFLKVFTVLRSIPAAVFNSRWLFAFYRADANGAPVFLLRNIALIGTLSTACGEICSVLEFFDQCPGYSWFFALACGYPHHLPPPGGFFVLENSSWCKGWCCVEVLNLLKCLNATFQGNYGRCLFLLLAKCFMIGSFGICRAFDELLKYLKLLI